MLLNGAGTKFEFHYNATRDSYATSPNGWSYSMFLQQYGNKITSVKALSAVHSSTTVPRTGSSQSQCVQPPSPVPNLSSIPPEAAHLLCTSPPTVHAVHQTGGTHPGDIYLRIPMHVLDTVQTLLKRTFTQHVYVETTSESFKKLQNKRSSQ